MYWAEGSRSHKETCMAPSEHHLVVTPHPQVRLRAPWLGSGPGRRERRAVRLSCSHTPPGGECEEDLASPNHMYVWHFCSELRKGFRRMDWSPGEKLCVTTAVLGCMRCGVRQSSGGRTRRLVSGLCSPHNHHKIKV